MASGTAVKISPWGKKNVDDESPVVSFVEIMNEELAEQLEEEKSGKPRLDQSLAQYGLNENDIEDCSDDFALARALQAQFDREYEQCQVPKNLKNKVELNFEPYHPCHEQDMGSDEEESEDDEDLRELATNMLYAKLEEEFPACGFVKDAEGHIVTKHDKEMSEKRNSNKAMQLPIDLPTGDVIGEKLSNRVYNTLRTYSKQDVKRNLRLKDKEEKATNDQSMDRATRMILFKWINTGRYFDEINGVIATGKESVVLHAATRNDSAFNNDGTHYAIKVYRMNLIDFKNRSEYVVDDYRFKNPRRVLRVWAEKEFMNLNRIVRANLPCPVPILLKKHCLLMSHIGSKGKAAPQLRNIEWGDNESKVSVFAQVRKLVNVMFKECRLIHGDLSEFNLLYHMKKVYIIDVSQAMDVSHPRSLFFLLRDIENVLKYFGRIGTPDLISATEFFNEVTGLQMDPTQNLMVQVENFEKDNRNMQLREDKVKPADCDLRIYQSEVAATNEDPAELYR
ncbi:hypothetical protein AB6A40_002871 [Gnathostoma spinigerum]|uniref:Serine/threonine-protein kinase RIO3 n=1 Tax=Gnathostoma spinigerum TaxID=75299 RepID=A0ABD6EHW8_9BILA